MVSEEHKYGHPDLHQLMAAAFWKGKEKSYYTYIPKEEKHYLNKWKIVCVK